MPESNYEIAKRSSARLFCQTDHSQLIQRFGVQEKGGFLLVPFFGKPFRLNLETGTVERCVECCAESLTECHAGCSAKSSVVHPAERQSERPAVHSVECDSVLPAERPLERAVTPPEPCMWVQTHYDEAMTLYDLFSYAKPTCKASNIMVNMKSLHLQVAASAPSSTPFYARQEAAFAKAEERCPGIVNRALSLYGGCELHAAADCAFQFNVLSDLNMQVHFWLADEDFPASLQLYWDKTVLDYMHYETVWYANSFILNELVALLPRLPYHAVKA